MDYNQTTDHSLFPRQGLNPLDPSNINNNNNNNNNNVTSDPEGVERSERLNIILRIQTCIIPTICVFGLLANSLAIRTFLSGNMRKSSCSIYLATKCLSDNGFLLATAIMWSSRFEAPLFNQPGVCEITVFLTYMCSFISVWLMAVITCENYIRIAHSFWVNSCCTATRAYTVIAVFMFVGFLLNMFHLWTTGVEYPPHHHHPHHHHLSSPSSTPPPPPPNSSSSTSSLSLLFHPTATASASTSTATMSSQSTQEYNKYQFNHHQQNHHHNRSNISVYSSSSSSSSSSSYAAAATASQNLSEISTSSSSQQISNYLNSDYYNHSGTTSANSFSGRNQYGQHYDDTSNNSSSTISPYYYNSTTSSIENVNNHTVFIHIIGGRDSSNNISAGEEIQHGGSSGQCKSLMSYADLLITMTYVDTVLTLLLPSIFMLVLVVIILKNVISSVRRRKRLRAGTQRAHGIRRTVTPQAKMTRFLLAVSLIFLVLHTPSHVIRIKMIVDYFVFGQQPSDLVQIFHRLFELLYNVNFCNNCIVFLAFGENFRQSFCTIFCQRFKHSNKKSQQGLSQYEAHDCLQSEMTELVPNPS